MRIASAPWIDSYNVPLRSASVARLLMLLRLSWLLSLIQRNGTKWRRGETGYSHSPDYLYTREGLFPPFGVRVDVDVAVDVGVDALPSVRYRRVCEWCNCVRLSGFLPSFDLDLLGGDSAPSPPMPSRC